MVDGDSFIVMWGKRAIHIITLAYVTPHPSGCRHETREGWEQTTTTERKGKESKYNCDFRPRLCEKIYIVAWINITKGSGYHGRERECLSRIKVKRLSVGIIRNQQPTTHIHHRPLNQLSRTITKQPHTFHITIYLLKLRKKNPTATTVTMAETTSQMDTTTASLASRSPTPTALISPPTPTSGTSTPDMP